MKKMDGGQRGLRLTLKVPKERAEEVRGHLLSLHLFDPERSTGRDGEHIYFPIQHPEGLLPAALTDLLGNPRSGIAFVEDDGLTSRRQPIETPFERVENFLSGSIPSDLIPLLPRRWEMIGDALILRLDEELLGSREIVCGAYSKVLGARYVMVERGGISGELREPDMEVVIPPEDGVMEVKHIENGIAYILDPSMLMFSSGNNWERMRAFDISRRFPGPDRPGGAMSREIVYDMFAGIGYFTLPMARGNPHFRIVSCEKNPSSFGYLMRNVIGNGLKDRVVPVLGDCRTSLPEGIAHRIMMGFVGGTIDYLEMAARYLSPSGGWIHMHDTVQVEIGIPGLFEDARMIIGGSRPGSKVTLEGHHRVKSYAPRIGHVVLDMRVA